MTMALQRPRPAVKDRTVTSKDAADGLSRSRLAPLHQPRIETDYERHGAADARCRAGDLCGLVDGSRRSATGGRRCSGRRAALCRALVRAALVTPDGVVGAMLRLGCARSPCAAQ